MTAKTRPYFSYLLRIWQENDREVPVWRASLEDPQTGQRRGFLDLDALIDFIHAKTGEDRKRLSEGLSDDGLAELA